MKRRKKTNQNIFFLNRKIRKRSANIAQNIFMCQRNRFWKRFTSRSKKHNRLTIFVYFWHTEKTRKKKRLEFFSHRDFFENIFQKYKCFCQLFCSVVLYFVSKAFTRQNIGNICKIYTMQKCFFSQCPVEHDGNFPSFIYGHENHTRHPERWKHDTNIFPRNLFYILGKKKNFLVKFLSGLRSYKRIIEKIFISMVGKYLSVC